MTADSTSASFHLSGRLATEAAVVLSANVNGGTPYDVATLELNPSGRLTLDVGTIYGSGQAVPERIYYGVIRTYRVARGAVELDVAALRTDCEPGGRLHELLARVAAGHDSEYDRNSNERPTLTDDASDAEDDLASLIERGMNEGWWQTERTVWDAGDWLLGRGSYREAAHDLARDEGLTADSTDDDCRRIAATLERNAAGDGILLDGDTAAEVERCRRELRDERDEQREEEGDTPPPAGLDIEGVGLDATLHRIAVAGRTVYVSTEWDAGTVAVWVHLDPTHDAVANFPLVTELDGTPAEIRAALDAKILQHLPPA